MPDTLDLAAADAGLKGFRGGFTDGTYGYFCPYNNGVFSGKVARINLHNFTSSAVSVLDLASVDSDLGGYMGGFTDGTYGYFVPHAGTINGDGYKGKIARVALNDFSASGVSSLDLAAVDSKFVGFKGGFSDGIHGYYVPYSRNSGTSGTLVRVALDDFSPSGVSSLDLKAVDYNLAGFSAAFYHGKYAYLVPSRGGSYGFEGVLARVDLADFTASGVTTLNLKLIDSELVGFEGGFTDGTYGYLVPNHKCIGTGCNGGHGSGKMVRFALDDFSTGSVTVLDLTSFYQDLVGFEGGFTDGQYGYLVPNRGNHGNRGEVARIALNDFTVSGVSMLDVKTATGNADLTGFSGGFTDGMHGYLVPNTYTTVVRFAVVPFSFSNNPSGYSSSP